ncbi:MAG: hypothetical protein KC636_09855 [Myxococcales bacterium]|nr:hypothetical protein [Myxococcales bacterium]
MMTGGAAWLVACGLLLVLGLGLSRALARARSEGSRRIVALTGHHQLHVVEVEGRRLLVGTGPAGPPSLLYELPPAPAEQS